MKGSPQEARTQDDSGVTEVAVKRIWQKDRDSRTEGDEAENKRKRAFMMRRKERGANNKNCQSYDTWSIN